MNNQLHYCGVSPYPGEHVLIHGDSRSFSYAKGFGLLITCPPYYHPRRASTAHGDGYVGKISSYVETISGVIARCAKAVKNRRVCLVKTDVWYRGTLIPVGFELARACMNRGLQLRGHSVFNRLASYTPYGPTFSNVFVFADSAMRPRCPGVLELEKSRRHRGVPSSFTPELFIELVSRFSDFGDTLLDPFAGVGAVFHAAEASARSSVGIESSARQVAKACALLRHKNNFKLVRATMTEAT